MWVTEFRGDGNGLHRVQAQDVDHNVLEAIDVNRWSREAKGVASVTEWMEVTAYNISSGQILGTGLSNLAWVTRRSLERQLLNMPATSTGLTTTTCLGCSSKSKNPSKYSSCILVEQEIEARKKAWVFLVTGLGTYWVEGLNIQAFRACKPKKEYSVPLYVAPGTAKDKDLKILVVLSLSGCRKSKNNSLNLLGSFGVRTQKFYFALIEHGSLFTGWSMPCGNDHMVPDPICNISIALGTTAYV
ncbi:hypothetical protein F5879DRAFT_926416 [Lentinula edodes]|nr:hypothetical protein F5879DRAFT_926416 [Lentinula edodes]